MSVSNQVASEVPADTLPGNQLDPQYIAMEQVNQAEKRAELAVFKTNFVRGLGRLGIRGLDIPVWGLGGPIIIAEQQKS